MYVQMLTCQPGDFCARRNNCRVEIDVRNTGCGNLFLLYVGLTLEQ